MKKHTRMNNEEENKNGGRPTLGGEVKVFKWLGQRGVVGGVKKNCSKYRSRMYTSDK